MRHFDHRPLSIDSLAMARYARAPLLATKAVIPAEAVTDPSQDSPSDHLSAQLYSCIFYQTTP